MKKIKKAPQIKTQELANSNGQQMNTNGQIVKLVSNQSEKYTLLAK